MTDGTLKPSIDHPILGQLELKTPVRKVGAVYRGVAVRGNAKFKVELYLKAQPLSVVLGLAEMLVLKLDDLSARARTVATRDLLVPYNMSWRPKDQPVFSEAAFLDQIIGVKKLTVYAEGLCLLLLTTKEKLFDRQSVYVSFPDITLNPASIAASKAYGGH